MNRTGRVRTGLLLAAASGWMGGSANANGQPVPRSALVIGNGAYRGVPLRNPVRDARAVGQALQDLGFAVETLRDADWNTLVQALARFPQRTQHSAVRLVYYAGHGMQAHGRNYLNPIGPAPASEFELRSKAVDVDEFLLRLAQIDEGASIVIVDACRANPWSRLVRPSRQLHPDGLAPTAAPHGLAVAFSTGPGSLAADRPEDANSPYARHLLEALKQPGLTVEQLFKRVHAGVERDTGRAQRPWLSTSLVGDLCLRPQPSGRCGSN